MAERRALLDHILLRGRPTVVREHAPPPVAVADGLWRLERWLRMPGGLVMPNATTIVRLASGGLLVVSPPPTEAGGLEALDALGPVEEVLLPNAFHYLGAPAFLARHPGARLRWAPGLPERVGTLPAGEAVGADAPPSWRGVVEHAVFGPARGVSEVALFHVPSATLVLTDLAFHLLRYPRPGDRLAWRLFGVPAGFGPSRTARWLLLANRDATPPFLRRVSAWPFTRVLVAHGEPLEHDAAATFARAFAPWRDGGG